MNSNDSLNITGYVASAVASENTMETSQRSSIQNSNQSKLYVGYKIK